MKKRILLYSHDSYGLGHLRRNLLLASAARREDREVLVLTGSPLASRFIWPQGVNFISMPGMIKVGPESYMPDTPDFDPQRVIGARKAIIQATVRQFRPDVFVVDKVPTGLLGETLDAMNWLKRNTGCRMVLGLRDILDEPAVVGREWGCHDVRYALSSLYDEVWVYGSKSVYDALHEYPELGLYADKVQFTGYWYNDSGTGREGTDESGGDADRVLVTVGGGGDGIYLLESFLDYYENAIDRPDRVDMVTGPFMPGQDMRRVERKSSALGLNLHCFNPDIGSLMDAARLIVCMGGYNTLCETLGRRRGCLIVPRESPRREQSIRAEIFDNMGMAVHLPMRDVTPESFDRAMERAEIMGKTSNSPGLPFTASEVVRHRLDILARESE